MKLKVDFYADGFRSGVIEIPDGILGLYADYSRRIITEKLIEHLPKDREWKISTNPLNACNDNVIIIIKAMRENER